MNEIDLLLSGFTGGAISGLITVLVFYFKILFSFNEKIKTIQLQLISLRIELNKYYDETNEGLK